MTAVFGIHHLFDRASSGVSVLGYPKSVEHLLGCPKLGSEIRDPGSEIHWLGSGIRDPKSNMEDPGSKFELKQNKTQQNITYSKANHKRSLVLAFTVLYI